MPVRHAPAPAFPLYGMDSPDPVRRALDWVLVHTENGTVATYGIWLAHLTAAGGTRVGSLDPAVLATLDDTPALAAAQHAITALADWTLPPGHPQLAPTTARHLTTEARALDRWTATTWQADGSEIPALTWSFAGGWAGIADLGHTYLCVLGTAPAPDAPSFHRLATTSPYGFDHTAPVDRAHHRDEHRLWQESLLPPPNSAPHPDHLRLVERGRVT